MSRELRTRARARIQPDTDDESDESDDEGTPAQIPSTSIQDLINPADAQQFDQTFSDADANLSIEGAFDPVAGPKQVIPRIAYVLNFNLVYNEAQERWEPDTGNESSGSGSGTTAASSLRADQGGFQNIPGDDSRTTVRMDTIAADELGTVSPQNNSITIESDGVYTVLAHTRFDNDPPPGDYDMRVTSNGLTVALDDGFPNSRQTLTLQIGQVEPFSANDVLKLTVEQDSGSSADLDQSRILTHLSVHG